MTSTVNPALLMPLNEWFREYGWITFTIVFFIGVVVGVYIGIDIEERKNLKMRELKS